jgi:hypothetical protein
MARELILHIGTTKTGSTSIQYVLDAKRKELPAQGAYWPETHGAKRHLLLALSNSSAERFHEMLGNPLWQGMEPASRIEAYQAEFAREMSSLPDSINRVIISAEQFSELLRSKSEIRQLHSMLAPHFSKISVVIYLRRQDSHYSSMYAQMLRMGNLRRPDLSTVRIGFNHDYDYLDLLNRWAAVFGEAAMQPRLFERTGTARFDVVDDFLDYCGLKLTLSADDQKRSRNPSMNLLGQQVLLQTGEIMRRKTGEANVTGFLWNKIAEAVTQALPGNGWLPTQAEAEAFLARFEAANEAVRQRWFPERETLFARDFSKLPKEPPAEDPAAMFAAACAAFLEASITSMKREQASALQIAKLAEATGDHKRMRTALVQILRADSRNIPARLQMAEHHIAQGNLSAARGSLNAAYMIAPKDPAVRKLEERLSELEATAGDGSALPGGAANPPPGAARAGSRGKAHAAEAREARMAARAAAKPRAHAV